MDTTDNATKQSHLLPNILATALTLISVGAAIIAWRQVNIGPLDSLSVYEVFPLFGLIAFSLLWCLYTTDAAANYLEVENETLRHYYRITGYVLLAALLAHPLLLIVPLWNDGFGPPPGSYSAYIGEKLVWVVMLGTVSWLVFLSYELGRWFKQKNWWRWIVYANDIAMLAILYHGFRIGGELQSGWFRYVWFFYGAMFVIYLVYMRFYRHTQLDRSSG